MELKDKCKIARLNRCLSQKEFALLVNSTQTEISFIEKGFIPVDVKKINKLLQEEFKRRNFKFNNKSNWGTFIYADPYQRHHTNEYLTMCYWNLAEKHLRGQKDFTADVWEKLDEFYKKEIGSVNE